MTGRSGPPAVSICALTKRYPRSDLPAVDDLYLEASEGQTVGLLGPNGAGKTTTIAVCTTRVQPTAGSVRIAGWDVTRHALRVRREIGVVTQQNTLDRSCTVTDNLYYHCRFFGIGHRAARARARELLEQFSLSARADMKPGWLSGGMVQRLQIARAIAHRPRVLFLDEPTAGLDPQSRLALWDQLEALKSDGTTVFLTTHYMEEADRLCDRLAIMDSGRVLVSGSPQELKRSVGAATRITLTVSDPTPDVGSDLRSLAGVQEVAELPSGYRVLADHGATSLARIVPAATPSGILDIAVSPPTLEDVFIALTGRELRD